MKNATKILSLTYFVKVLTAVIIALSANIVIANDNTDQVDNGIRNYTIDNLNEYLEESQLSSEISRRIMARVANLGEQLTESAVIDIVLEETSADKYGFLDEIEDLDERYGLVIGIAKKITFHLKVERAISEIDENIRRIDVEISKEREKQNFYARSMELEAEIYSSLDENIRRIDVEISKEREKQNILCAKYGA